MLIVVRLKIKARTTLRSPSPASDYAVICTAETSYSLRQVHSSNITFLVQPSALGLTATATLISYIELLTLTPNAKSLLEAQLLPFPSPGHAGKTRQQLLNDLPVSDADFCEAWTVLTAFEHDNGSAYLPSAQMVLKTLKKILTSVSAEGMNHCGPYSVQAVVLAIDDPEIPAGLVENVFARICDAEMGGPVLNRERCVKAVGGWVLEAWHAEAKGSEMLYPTFMAKWKSAVPVGCAPLCKSELLKVSISGIGVAVCADRRKDCHSLLTTNRITFVPDVLQSKKECAAESSGGGAKNKWHEKFRKGRES